MLPRVPTTSLLCPACGSKGKRVGLVTLRSLVKPEFREHIGPGPYRFCEAPRCDTVYYTEDGSDSFSRPDLAVRVGLKETCSPRMLCYCFGHTLEEIEVEVQHTGRTTVAEQISASLQNGCRCETMNPQGSCCLGVVQQYIKKVLERGGREEEETLGLETSDCCGSEADCSSAGPGRHLSMGGNL